MTMHRVRTPPPRVDELPKMVGPGSPLGFRWACTYPGQTHVILEPISGRMAAVWLWIRDHRAAISFLRTGRP